MLALVADGRLLLYWVEQSGLQSLAGAVADEKTVRCLLRHDSPTLGDSSMNNNQAVWSCTEWDPLQEVILGTARFARFPEPDVSTNAILYPHLKLEELPRGPFDQRVIDETEEDLALFERALKLEGVTVRRPEAWPHGNKFSTALWSARGFHNYCPRDTILIIGDLIIESPSPVRSRYLETASYRTLMLEYCKSGARWISAPQPLLRDAAMLKIPKDAKALPDDEVLFDAANVLRLGRDLLYLVSRTGNKLGAAWLQSILGDSYRVHIVENVYSGSHIDSTFVALRPGLMLCNPSRVNAANLPHLLSSWERVFCPPLVSTDFDIDTEKVLIGSSWIEMNLFSVGPNKVVVESRQKDLIRVLERCGLDVLPLSLRHARRLGGGFHCVTSDVRRAGPLESYF